MKLLVIDDDMLLARMIGVVLRHYGWETVTASSLHEGLQQMMATRFDSIVLDLNLPDSLWRSTIDRLAEIREKALGARLVGTSGFVPPGVIPGGFFDAVIPKVEVSSVDKLIEAITGTPRPETK